jgi:hypothetical protein
MRRFLTISFLVASTLIAHGQVRDSVVQNSAPAGGANRGYSGAVFQSGQRHTPTVATGTGAQDRFDFRVQERNLRVFNGSVGGTFRGGNWGVGGRGCYRGHCRPNVGYFYNPYLYAMPVYVEVNNGPDFNNQPSAYSVYTADVPQEYRAPGADAVAAAFRQGQLEQRLTSLADEVARLRAEKEARDAKDARLREGQPDRSFADANLAGANEPARGPANAATATLVFKNGTKLDIANYAVVGRTLWVFDEQRARKIALTDLDLAATRKLNAENGYDFHIPAK